MVNRELLEKLAIFITSISLEVHKLIWKNYDAVNFHPMESDSIRQHPTIPQKQILN